MNARIKARAANGDISPLCMPQTTEDDFPEV